MQKIIGKGLHQADAECGAYTADLMDKLEQTKAENPNEDAINDDVAAQAYCEQFALEQFAKGDNQIRENRVTNATADVLQAASTFLELLAMWKDPLDEDIKSKIKYAKYHTLRIVKAIKAGEDPNLSNPKQETPVASPAPGAVPDVQSAPNPFQPYAESAPSTSAQTSPTFSDPPLNLPGAPTHTNQPTASPSPFPSHPDVSPISQPATTSRKNSEVSVGGGYFPRVDVSTFTAQSQPGVSAPTAMPGQGVTDGPEAPDPQSFYEGKTPPHLPSPAASSIATPHTQQPSQPPPPGFASPPPTTQPPIFQTTTPNPQQYAYSPAAPQLPPVPQQPPQQQGPLKTDEESITAAQKHAKWAISALNFEDVTTAVEELRIALRALGAS